MNLRKLLCASAALLVVSLTANADTLTWQGGTADIGSSNYFNVNTSSANQTPTTTDNLYIGANGTATYNVSGGIFSTGRLFSGHSLTSNPGVGTVLLLDGTIAANSGTTGSANAGITVGSLTSGTIIVSGGTLTSNVGIVVGYGTSGTPKAFLSVGTTAYISTTAGDLIIGSGTGNGQPGTFLTSGNGSIAGNLTVGAVKGAGYTQNSGSITVGNSLTVGQSDTTATTFTMNSGTLTVSQFVESNSGANRADTVNLTGDAWLETTFGTSAHNFTIGSGASNVGTKFNIGGNATVKSGNRFLIGSSATTMNIANNIVITQTGGTNTFTRNLSIADANGYATYNMSGGTMGGGNETSVVGRAGNGFLIQTGGTISINNGLNVADRQSATNAGSLNNSGFYQISGGTLSVNSTGMVVGPAGAGTFNVVGQDANISIAGSFSVAATNSNAKGNSGTLSFTLQPGEGLSQIVASGNGTFGAGSHIVIDDGGNTPTQFVYDVLTAVTVADNGLIFQAPANWSYAIVPGGNGQFLELYSPEPSSLAILGLSSIVLLQRRKRCA